MLTLTRSTSTMPRHTVGLARVLGLAFMCAAFFTACTWAQPQPSGNQPQGEPKDLARPGPTTQPAPVAEAVPKPAPAPEAKPAPGSLASESGTSPQGEPTTQPTGQVKPKGKAKSDKKGRQTAPFEMDPNAKWACEQMTATQPPVWRGDKKLTFAFEIRNEGTADLKINAKGG